VTAIGFDIPADIARIVAGLERFGGLTVQTGMPSPIPLP
jgi:hypothetical protein